ncbi:hypothetical protein SBRCBS47491_006032 [Sporothrix bragantina]|uniref:Zn(2)-C6 fungal-type domain-containing protein n=1 Tax=Sporothrix bragantina TaxID=671064 RepID=A0ABP0C3U1_9PEZI
MDTLGQARLGAEDAQASSGTSGRKGSKKVRSGCITCKIRKVKCDETKPYCLRCTKTGRKCDGYLDDAALAIRRQRRRRPEPGLFDDSAVGSQGQLANALPTHAATTTAASTPEISSAVKSSSAATFKSRLLDRQPWETAQEKRAFDFFRHTTAPCLAGDLDAVFWRVLVLQICHTEPAVWHAVLAVSSLHEVLLQSSSEPCMPLQDTSGAPSPSAPSPSCAARIVLQTEFALRHYNKAIAYLLDDMKLESTDMSGCGFDATAKSAPRRPVTLLMTCVLFVWPAAAETAGFMSSSISD